MAKHKRIVAALLAVVLMCCTLTQNTITYAAEDESPEISGEIEVVLNRSQDDMEKYIEAFESKYPGVTVKYTTYSDYETSIQRRMNEGDYGDVLFVPTFLNNYDYPKYFESLGNTVKLGDKYNYMDYSKHLNVSVYGLPSAAYLLGIVYNEEVFAKAGIASPPATMDDFLYAMYLINEHTDAIPFYSGYREGWILQYWENFQFVEMTGDPTYRYGAFVVEENPFREGTVHYKTLHFLYDLVEYGYTEMPESKNLTWDKALTMLHDGEIACTAVGTWAFYLFKEAGDNPDNIAFMPFPNTVDGVQYTTLNADYCYAVSKNSENKEAAKAFVYFMLDESGYAFDHDQISILKTDPFPECYSGMTQTSMQNSEAISTSHYSQFLKLSANLNLSDTSEYARIVDAAAGTSEESFDEIMDDWNARWESSRTEDMITEMKDVEQDVEESILDINNLKVEFSENESKYMTENPVVRVGYHTNLAPLSFEGIEGFAGAAYDVCSIIEQVTGMTMEYYGYANAQALEDALLNGEIDMIAGIEKAESSADLRYSKEYLDYMDVMVRHSTADGESLKKIAITEGEVGNSVEQAEYGTIYGTVGECVAAVQNMDVDYTVTNYYSANYYMRERNCKDVTILPYVMNKTYHLGFSEETSPTLIAICNKCIYSVPDGEMQIALMGYMDSVVDNVTIATFISANPILAISICVGVFAIILFATCLVFSERLKANRKQALEAKKHESLAALADEYFFEYECSKQQLTFEAKFREEFHFAPVVDKNNVTEKNVFFTQFFEQIEKCLSDKTSEKFKIALEDENGMKQWYRVVTSVIYDKKQQPVHVIGKFVSIQKEMEEVANYQNKAHRDPLTKIYNRDGFRAHIPEGAEDVTFAIMDMDNFKMVNDTLGHDGGDYALTYFARVLEEQFSEIGLAGRYGGDEFIIMMIGVSAEDADRRLEKLVKSMDVELNYEGKIRHISISVGAVYTAKLESYDEIFRQADKVLYQTKEAGKNGYKLVRG